MNERAGITAGSTELIGGMFFVFGLGHLYSGHVYIGIVACVAFECFRLCCLHLGLGLAWFYSVWLLALVLSPLAVIRSCQRDFVRRCQQTAAQGEATRQIVEREPAWTQDFADEGPAKC